MNAESMKKIPNSTQDEQTSKSDMRLEYDFQGGVRGKYVQRFVAGIQRDMIPEHAREAWDKEVGINEKLLPPAQTQPET